AQLGECAGDEGGDPARRTQVGSHRVRAGFLQLGSDGAGGAHDPDALVDQGPDGGQSDAAAGAGDNSGLVGEIELHDALQFQNYRIQNGRRDMSAKRVAGDDAARDSSGSAGRAHLSRGSQVASLFAMRTRPNGLSGKWTA